MFSGPRQKKREPPTVQDQTQKNHLLFYTQTLPDIIHKCVQTAGHRGAGDANAHLVRSEPTVLPLNHRVRGPPRARSLTVARGH